MKLIKRNIQKSSNKLSKILILESEVRKKFQQSKVAL